MADPQGPPPVRLSEPGELVAALPYLLGFPPHESLVLVGLRGSAGRGVGLTARVDLPAPAHRGPVVAGLVRALLTDGATAAVLVVVSEADDEPAPAVVRHRGPTPDVTQGLAHRDLVHEVVLALHAVEVRVGQALLVRRGRWWSYDCAEPCCAPEAGAPLPTGTSELAAATVVAGQVVEAERAALARRIAPVGSPAAEAMARACDEVGDALARRTAELGWDVLVEEGWTALLAAVRATGPGEGGGGGGRLSDHEVARLAWGLRDHDLRDRALTLALGGSAATAEGLWTELTRRSPAPLDAAPATLLAVSAWVRGDGALANVALDRALRSEPSYTFAGLLRSALDACLPPEEMRRLIRQASGPLDARW